MTTAQIAKVREASDLVAIAAEYTKLTKRGAEWWCRCLFHSEKSGSLHFHPEMQVYKCFGCGASGDVFQFVMAMEGVPFPQAVKLLAESAGIDLDKEERLTMDQKVEMARRRQQAEMEAGDCAAWIRESCSWLVARDVEIRQQLWRFEDWAKQRWAAFGDLSEDGWAHFETYCGLSKALDAYRAKLDFLEDSEPRELLLAYRAHRAVHPLTAELVQLRDRQKETKRKFLGLLESFGVEKSLDGKHVYDLKESESPRYQFGGGWNQDHIRVYLQAFECVPERDMVDTVLYFLGFPVEGGRTPFAKREAYEAALLASQEGAA